MSETKYICVDLDGTNAHYKKWQGEEVFGDPIEGVQVALECLKNSGWKIIIYTTRSNKSLVGEYLNSNSIPFDYINFNPDQPRNAIGGKLNADVYIDDREIQFNGNWSETLNEVLHFSRWETRSDLDHDDGNGKKY